MSGTTNQIKGSGKTAGTSKSHKSFESADKAKAYAVKELKYKRNTWFRVYKLEGKFYPAWTNSMIPTGAIKVLGYSRKGGIWEGNARI